MTRSFLYRIPHRLYSRVIVYGKRPRQTVIFLHGIGNSGAAWQEVVEQLVDKNVRLVVVDLLGFGKSPRPKYARYDAVMQAQSVRLTCLLRGIFWHKAMIVGHSMGALVAVEYAKRYPRRTKSLLLCSPPLYAPPKKVLIPSSEAILRKLYVAVQASPQRFLRFLEFAMKYELINASFDVTDRNIDSYMSALHAAIVNQTALDDLTHLTVPVHIIRGTLDPVIVPKHIRSLVRTQYNITSSTTLASHEVTGRFARKAAQYVRTELATNT